MKPHKKVCFVSTKDNHEITSNSLFLAAVPVSYMNNKSRDKIWPHMASKSCKK